MKKSKSTEPETSNRTGLMFAPEPARELLEGISEFSPKPDMDMSAAAAIRSDYITEGIRVGSMPPADHKAMGMLLDRIGARLVFERSGVRLYDLMIQKRAAKSGRSRPNRNDLEQIRNEELEHTQMLEACIIELDGDPTLETPSADIIGMVSSGVFHVAADPRTSMDQCLEAILAAELIDNDCWAVLIEMLRASKLDDHIPHFEEALRQEKEHLTRVRQWIRHSVT